MGLPPGFSGAILPHCLSRVAWETAAFHIPSAGMSLPLTICRQASIAISLWTDQKWSKLSNNVLEHVEKLRPV